MSGRIPSSPSIKSSDFRYSRADIMTVPNLITFVRLLFIPVFLYFLFARDNRAAAAWILGGLGATDWVDGSIARRFGMVSEFGKIFDPAVDRLMFFIAIPAILIDGAVPLWVAGSALLRELLVAVLAIRLASVGERLEVTWEGKTAAFLLMFAFPLFLGAQSTLSYAGVLEWLAWITAIPGLGYGYWSLLMQYLPTARRALSAAPE